MAQLKLVFKDMENGNVDIGFEADTPLPETDPTPAQQVAVAALQEVMAKFKKAGDAETDSE